MPYALQISPELFDRLYYFMCLLYLAIWSSSSSCCFLILGGAGLALLGLAMLRLLKRKGEIWHYYNKSNAEQWNPVV